MTPYGRAAAWQVKNYAIWLRCRSRTDQHNMYKEYRGMTVNGAVSRMCP